MINHYYQRDWYGMLDLSEATISPGEVHHWGHGHGCHGSLPWGDGFYSENPRNTRKTRMICLHWTTNPLTFQVRENHVVE